MKKKHLVGIMLFALMLFAMIPGQKAEAASVIGDNWKLTGDMVLTVTGDDFAVTDSQQLKGFKNQIVEVIIKKGVTELDSRAFSGCEGIKKVTFQNSLEKIPTGCFSGCTSLEEVVFPTNLRIIDDGAFYNTGIKKLNLPKNLEKIEDNAFYGCENLSGELVIPEGVTLIDSAAFKGCINITGVKLPSTLTEVDYGSFSDCTSIKSLKMPANIKTLGSYAFSGCTSLKKVELNAGLKTVGGYAFEDCSSLEEIICPSTVENISVLAFIRCKALKNVVIMNSSASIYNDDDTLGGKTATVHGLFLSTAQAHAQKFGNPFHLLEDKTVKKPTAGSYGEKKYTCSECGAVYKEELLPLELEAPDVTSLENTGTGVKIKWKKAAGAEGYKVYKKLSGGEYKLIKTTKNLSYIDTAVQSNKYYYYAVKAYTSLQTTELGEDEYIQCLKRTSISSVTATSSGVSIKWKKIDGVYNYYIYRNGKQIASVSSYDNSYVDTGAKKNGTLYKYEVGAYSYSAGTVKSSPKKICYLTKQKVTSATNKSGKKLQVKFNKNNLATGYQVQYGTSSTFKSSLTKSKTYASYKTTTKTLTGLTKGKTYYVRVRSYKKVDGVTYYGPWSDKKSVKITK